MSDTLALAKALVAMASVSPTDNGCQDLLCERLKKLDFNIEECPFGEVKNFYATRGQIEPLLVFAGHTDVVPTGPKELWQFPPFSPTEHEGLLYGRGSADMKGSLAAMVVACEQFIAEHPKHKGSIGFLITSDEEGPSIDGTVKVVETLQARNIHFNYAIVGEPTSCTQFGDMIKIGRRGTLSGNLIIHGKQGHIAYPHLAKNPIHACAPVIGELIETVWDEGNDFFQPTSFQISNIHGGTGAGNVIPGQVQIDFNFRYSPEITAAELQQRVHAIVETHKHEHELYWHHSGKPFLSERGLLLETATQVISETCGRRPEISTSGGTSDARFITDICPEIIEFGPVNKTIHQIDECVGIDELNQLSNIYYQILCRLLT